MELSFLCIDPSMTLIDREILGSVTSVDTDIFILVPTPTSLIDFYISILMIKNGEVIYNLSLY
jgi:hypothetical protein